jgi:acetaldehyde dehydrogenase (acetylating)
MAIDYDLTAIQETRDLARKAKEAQKEFSKYSEEEIDRIIYAMSQAVQENAQWLAKMAVDETKYGIYEHKIIKNIFASKDVYSYIKDIKTIGVINEDKEKRVVEVAEPMGVIMGIIPTTNPTSTLIHNALCALKAGNAIVFSPHPNAVRCSNASTKILYEAAIKAGAPEGIIGCLSKITMSSTQELMHHDDIDVIVATGGSGMVKAAYSAGKPAYGVGPGNVPAYIEPSADIKQAVADIVTSKSFDSGMICASEQSIITDESQKDAVLEELKNQGCYILSEEEIKKVGSVVMNSKGGVNPALVGKRPEIIAQKAGIEIPKDTKLLVAELDGYGEGYPLSYEKLTTVLAFYTAKDWEDACHLSIELLNLGGLGHTLAIHSQNEEIIREYMIKPVARIIVNSPSSLGGVGYTTGITPSMTLGCGTWGGSSLSDNLGPQHLINVKRVAYGIRKADINSPQTGINAGNEKN